jgi:hypothetical protein
MRNVKQTLLGAVLLTAFAVGGVAQTDEETVVRDVKAMKAALETLKARLSNVEPDALQSADEMEAFHEEFAAIRHRLGQTLDSQPRSDVSSTVSPGTYVSLNPDVTSTGAIGRAAAPPVGQVPSRIAELTPGVTTSDNKQLGKAEELLRHGDIVGARWVLEHALRGGNPLVAFKLAETYDARHLAAWGVIGIRGDATKAREFYERAHTGGVPNAQERIADLRS